MSARRVLQCVHVTCWIKFGVLLVRDVDEARVHAVEKRAPDWKLSVARDKPDLLKEVL